MLIRSIDLENFRLHRKTKLQFSENLNYIIGGNGQGKTTILEAIYYLCTTRSINQLSDVDAVTFDNQFFCINGKFEDIISDDVRVYYEKESKKKTIVINYKQVYKSSSIIGRFPVVTITQSDHAITLGSPADRRKFVDSVISQASDTYLKILIDYNKTLRQRSLLLLQLREKRSNTLLNELSAWTRTLVDYGSELARYRLRFVSEFNEYVKISYSKVMEGKEKPSVYYSFLDYEEFSDLKQKFFDLINQKLNEEIRQARNLVGPHRDEFDFKINDRDLKKFGSQGQHKTFQIALRFGQFFYLKDKLRKTPIFLMDDVFGELDSYRAKMISGYLKYIGQAFITLTDLPKFENLSLSNNDKIININNGAAINA